MYARISDLCNNCIIAFNAVYKKISSIMLSKITHS